MTNELIQFNPGIARSHVAIVGSPQYDFHKDSTLLKSREEYCGSLNLNPARPYVLIGTGTAKWMPDEMQKMVQLVARIRREIPEMQVVIRLHPKDQGDRWKPHMKELQSKGVHIQYSSPDVHMDKGGFIPPRDFYREQVNVINHAAVVINSSSSLTVDAAIFDKPVICIGYDLAPDSLFPEGRSKAYSQSSHFGKLVKTGGVPVVRNEDECIEWIKIYLKDPSRLREERKKIVELVTDGIIGDSGMRMANEVMSMIQ
jgi:UDP-N-acetylglucosamine 2-epimerase